MGIVWGQGTVEMTAAFGKKEEGEKSPASSWKPWASGSSEGVGATESPPTGPRRRWQRPQGFWEETGDPTFG